MKITFFEVKDWEKEYLGGHFPNGQTDFFTEKLSAENVSAAQDAEIVCIFIESEITAQLLEKLPKLKMIATRSTGFDHIDIKACQTKGIVVCHVPHYGDNTVAEHAFGLMLDLSRKIHQSINQVRAEGFSVKGLVGFDLQGKTMGIIGTGRIGTHVARIAQGFEMKVIAFDPNQDKKIAKKLGFTYVPFEELLQQSDIITLHVPFNERTKYLINSQNIRLIKPGAYLINTARGGIVETEALVKALEEGILAGAGLDVLEEENILREESQLLSEAFSKQHNLKTLLQNHILMEKDNVIITPHNAFNSREALERILQTTVENIQSFEKGKTINQCTI